MKMKHSYCKPPKPIFILCIFVIVLGFLLNVRTAEGYDVNTYNDPDNLSYLWTYTSFSDGKIILNFVINKNDTCFEPIFYYRIIHLNGTIVPIKIVIPDIELFNFCVGIYGDPYFNMHTLNSDYFMITYLKSQQIENVTYYQRVGVLVNLNGEMINKINITEPLNFQSTTQLTKNISPEDGFLITNIVSLQNDQEWIMYSAP